MLVRIFDHHDRRIDHGAKRNRDTAEAHDVRADAECMHAGKGDQNANRQRDDGDERTADMQQKDDADEGDNETFFEQRAFQRVDRGVD